MIGEDDERLSVRSLAALADLAAAERRLTAERPEAADQIHAITTAATWEILKVLIKHRGRG